MGPRVEQLTWVNTHLRGRAGHGGRTHVPDFEVGLGLAPSVGLLGKRMRRLTAKEDQHGLVTGTSGLNEHRLAGRVQLRDELGSEPGTTAPCPGTDGRTDEDLAFAWQPDRLSRHIHLAGHGRHPPIHQVT
ncbi:Uncharacterised protein [Mycobacterium tuberculosis]|uniref:Uncharacterized protein n=2 Tax=Mycobacterium tuberculosis TaxID=1773 RepID=A0A654TU97_MYCTX|nr:hypothetical protein [Mycobacterium tuberculosis]AFE12728.1 hypothetical protein MRGA423_09140 [Mycobacterium tuberculosis RGTB423]CFE84726.1 Uncharacterised protein [Mycobacterium tuberculosis]CKR75882.1 Uncharacterised protein [Mycobacterium tuberculosis]CMQ93786.1 Uncharacterised protein [Mycobacterium tuberculosis]CNX16651.1 Uncharacterised protein [Mycobacterium tuberculosis]